MANISKTEILRKANDLGIKFIRLQFTDIFGMVKNVEITVEQLPKALDGQLMFDGSSIEGFVRIEESDMYLKPDPACNPYLALASTLKAGLDGIKNKIDPPLPVSGNIYEMSEAERRRYHIKKFPSDLGEAIKFMRHDPLVREALGDHIYSRMLIYIFNANGRKKNDSLWSWRTGALSAMP